MVTLPRERVGGFVGRDMPLATAKVSRSSRFSLSRIVMLWHTGPRLGGPRVGHDSHETLVPGVGPRSMET